MKSIRTSVSLTSKQHQLLQKLAESSNLSLSWVIRQAVTEFLKQHIDKDIEPLATLSFNNDDWIVNKENENWIQSFLNVTFSGQANFENENGRSNVSAY
jgi:predicted transcriptional regulator